MWVGNVETTFMQAYSRFETIFNPSNQLPIPFEFLTTIIPLSKRLISVILYVGYSFYLPTVQENLICYIK